MNLLSQIDLNNVPSHIAIIMDGNGRWAKKQGEQRMYGHSFGIDPIRKTLNAAKDIGVKHITLYTFSTENWNRPKEEIDGIMKLLVRALSNEIDGLCEDRVRVNTIGDIKDLPQECQDELALAKARTADNDVIQMTLALNYSARWEITEATKRIAEKVQQGIIRIEDVTNELLADHMTTHDMPDPELLIRTSGEHRISNFLLWQIAYTELHFTDVLWPDFTGEDLYKAVIDYQSRERRFGAVTEQI